MMHHRIKTGQRARRITRELPRVHQIFSHRHHFPVDLVALGALVVILACFLSLDQANQTDGAALGPVFLQAAVGLGTDPVSTKGHLYLRLRALGWTIEEGANILLPVSSGKSCGIGVNGSGYTRAYPTGRG